MNYKEMYDKMLEGKLSAEFYDKDDTQECSEVKCMSCSSTNCPMRNKLEEFKKDKQKHETEHFEEELIKYGITNKLITKEDIKNIVEEIKNGI